jgi:radical SAM superfamily enzyme YgiQ (UPF0313 family)
MHGIFLSSCVSNSLTQFKRPLGAYQLAWFLRQHGYNIQVIDFVFRLSENEIVELVEHFITPDTKFIGLSFMISSEHPHMRGIAKKLESALLTIKKQHPEILLIVGGGTAPFWSRYKKNKTLFDYYFRGYAEDTALALFNHVIRNDPAPQFELIDGNRHLKESFNMPHGKLFNIEESAFAWHDRDCIQHGEALPIEFGRGCIFKCTFCRYPHIGKSKNDFTRSMECIKNELVTNYEKWGVTNYYVTDDTFNADETRVQEFTKIVKSLPFKLNYAAFLRADLIWAKPETAQMFLDNGLLSVFFGIESFNPISSKLVNKAWSGKHAKTFIPELYHNIWKKQIHMTIGLIAGLPPDTLDDLRMYNQFMVDQEIPVWLWHPLSIERDSTNEYRSEFDSESEKFGIKWSIKDGKSMWYNEVCTAEEALDWHYTLLNEVKQYQSINTWNLIELGNYGYDIRAIKDCNNLKFDWQEVHVRSTQWLNEYFKQLKELPKN